MRTDERKSFAGAKAQQHKNYENFTEYDNTIMQIFTKKRRKFDITIVRSENEVFEHAVSTEW